jgi:phage baseplate assembly protein W
MAIKIANLEQIADQFKQKNHAFKDLHLDFGKTTQYNSTLKQRVEGNDIAVDYDENAIRNSLRNLFNTRPGQRFLFPLYGLDLYQYLFEAVSKENGQIIGERIVTSIENFEPRVRVQKCNVVAMPDDNQYDVTIIIQIPLFNTIQSINTTLDVKTQSFIFVETSRNR